MTVRVEKPAFNLRDKLSKLELPVGVHGSQILKSETPQDTFNIVSAGRKNMIINGDMRVSQRYSSAQTISSGGNRYFLDRWLSRNDTGATVAQSHSAESPDGHYRSLRLECSGADTSMGGTEYCRIQQYIEGYNLLLDWGMGANRDFATISFWVQSSVPGTYSVSIEDGDASTFCINEYQINRPNVWEWKTVTVPPPLNGDFAAKGTNNGLRVTFTLATVDQYKTTADQLGRWDSSGDYDMAGPNQVNFVGQTGNFYITGVQLERGKVATPFEYMRWPDTLALCQRYFHKINGSTGGYRWLYSIDGTQSYIRATIIHPVQMNGAPSVQNISLHPTQSSYNVQFNGNNSSTIWVNNTSQNVELREAWFDAEL